MQTVLFAVQRCYADYKYDAAAKKNWTTTPLQHYCKQKPVKWDHHVAQYVESQIHLESEHGLRWFRLLTLMQGLYLLQHLPGGLDSVEYYDIAANEWRAASTMPWRGLTVKCAAVGDIIYVLAGFQGVGRLGQVLEYHTDTDRWASVRVDS